MDTVILEKKELKKLGLNINQYLTLLKFYLLRMGEELEYYYTAFDVKFLEGEGYLKEDALTEKAMSIFASSGNNLWKEFYELFPSKVVNQGRIRALSTNSPDTAFGKKVKRIWDRVSKGNTTIQQEIIAGLKKELEFRQRDDSMGYLQNIETWLRNNTWEKWIDIETKSNNSSKTLRI